MLVSILIPVYNERPYLNRILTRVLEAKLPEGCERELVIVDDCSNDGSAAILDQFEKELPDLLTVFHQPANAGKGAAIKKAIELMRGEICIIQDADLEYSPEDYPQLLEPIVLGHADVVYGSRFLGRKRRRVLNYHHALGNQFLTHLSNMTTGLNLTDMETCYKAFRSDILRTIPLRSTRFGMEPEITAKVAKRNCVVYEVPINYHGRSYAEGKKITWRDGFEALAVIGKYWLIDDCFEDRYGHRILHSLAGARKLSAWMVKVLEPHLGNRILEIGSGIGNISRQLPKRERLTLSDVEPEFLKLLHQGFANYDVVNVVRLDLTDPASFAGLAESYDTVLCLNVLEHIEDDRSALRMMASALSPGGRLIILVPQHALLMSEMDRKLGHYRRYQRARLQQLFKQEGLSMLQLSDFNPLGALAWLVNARMLNRSDIGKAQVKMFELLMPIAKQLDRVAKLPGLSLIAVGQKK